MKIRNLVFYMIIATSVLFAKSGEELFLQHCASCHAQIIGIDESGGETTYITENAPYVADVIRKLKAKTKSKEDFISFISDYVNDPYARKSLYGKKAIKKFGLMPSLKGALSEEEISRLAKHLYDGYGKSTKKEKVAKVKKNNTGEKLFNKYCASCHMSVIGVSVDGCGSAETKYISDKAPYIKDLLTKLKLKVNTKDEFVMFIKDYINDPDKRKSLFGKKAIKEFGLMPSLKGVMSDRKSTQLADYLYNYKLD